MVIMFDLTNSSFTQMSTEKPVTNIMYILIQ